MLPPELYETRHTYPDGERVTVRIWREMLTDLGRVDIPEGDMDKWTPRYRTLNAEGQACYHRGTEFEPVFGLVEYHEVPSDITERERARLVEEDTPAAEFYDTIMRMRGTR